MNNITKITLTQFRNYSSAFFDFLSPVTCITGPNGSGKTNLLDAVYYLCYTKSYFSAYQQNSVQAGTDGFRVEGVFHKDGKEETIACKWRLGKKEITCNGSEYEKINDHIGRYTAVMIAPDDIELINDGSELRRKWADSILCQTEPRYFEVLLHYQRILLQRNAWLKMHGLQPITNFTELEYYDARLAESGAYIYQRRTVFMNKFMPLLHRFYTQLSGGKEVIAVKYESDLQHNSMEALLHDSLPNDIRFQRTLKGVHKDDWEFISGNISLKQFGSQGQKKSFLFALKLAQYAYINTELNHQPILLLDDIFEKLDQRRMEALLAIICSPAFGQVLLTDTHPQRVKDAFGNKAKLSFISLGGDSN